MNANALSTGIKRYQEDIVSLGLSLLVYLLKMSASLSLFVQAQRTTPLTRTGQTRVQIREAHIPGCVKYYCCYLT